VQDTGKNRLLRSGKHADMRGKRVKRGEFGWKRKKAVVTICRRKETVGPSRAGGNACMGKNCSDGACAAGAAREGALWATSTQKAFPGICVVHPRVSCKHLGGEGEKWVANLSPLRSLRKRGGERGKKREHHYIGRQSGWLNSNCQKGGGEGRGNLCQRL